MVYRRTAEIQARLDDQHATILRAGTELLAEGGYAACAIAAVAARAGVAAGTVYRHFDSKSVLIAEVFRSVVSHEVDAVRAAADVPEAVDERVAAVVATFAGRALKSPRLAYALLVEPVELVVDELRLEFRIAFRDVLAAVVADGVRIGAIPPQNAAVVAAALVGAIGEALVGPLSGAADDPDTIRTLTEFALRGLGIDDVAHA